MAVKKKKTRRTKARVADTTAASAAMERGAKKQAAAKRAKVKDAATVARAKVRDSALAKERILARRAKAKGKGKKGIDPELLAEARKVLPRLQAGETTMGAERDRLGFSSNRPMREALIEIMGSRKAYFDLLEARSVHTRFGGQKKGATGGLPLVSDKDVPVITSSKYTEGWHGGTFDLHGYTHDTVIAPDETEYVRCQANERADIIVDHTKVGLARSRWRKLDTSPKARAARREARLKSHGEAARQAKTAKKKKVQRKL